MELGRRDTGWTMRISAAAPATGTKNAVESFQCFNESAEGFAIETAYDDGKDCEEWEER